MDCPTDKEIKNLAIQKLGYDCHEIVYNTFIYAYKLGYKGRKPPKTGRDPNNSQKAQSE